MVTGNVLLLEMNISPCSSNLQFCRVTFSDVFTTGTYMTTRVFFHARLSIFPYE